ncbi:MAG: zinc ribbon domain-containing protein [Erysipelotrichaceae bacterium]|nr:zinc ribbon domain-containing protein [Erysipelotrichaceae bacterium]
MKCKNCGAEYSDDLVKCPYCGTMNRKGAYADFGRKVRDIIDNLFGLKDEAYDSVSKMIFVSILRSLLIILICLGIGFGIGMAQNVNYYQDVRYDEERYEDIVWENENLAALNKAYEEKDFDTFDSLLRQNPNVVYSWEHYSSFELQRVCEEILADDEYFDVFTLEDSLYFLFYPEWYASTYNMSDEELKIYEADRERILGMAEKHGYTEQQLRDIYERHKDNYGYISAADLDEYVKED